PPFADEAPAAQIAPVLVHSMCRLVHFASVQPWAPEYQRESNAMTSNFLSITYGLLDSIINGSPIWLGKCFFWKY
ncbi:MAG: hypothetical protein WA254_21280, partial [Candidatus Sulfotelmatobacter sp.]